MAAAAARFPGNSILRSISNFNPDGARPRRSGGRAGHSRSSAPRGAPATRSPAGAAPAAAGTGAQGHIAGSPGPARHPEAARRRWGAAAAPRSSGVTRRTQHWRLGGSCRAPLASRAGQSRRGLFSDALLLPVSLFAKLCPRRPAGDRCRDAPGSARSRPATTRAPGRGTGSAPVAPQQPRPRAAGSGLATRRGVNTEGAPGRDSARPVRAAPVALSDCTNPPGRTALQHRGQSRSRARLHAPRAHPSARRPRAHSPRSGPFLASPGLPLRLPLGKVLSRPGTRHPRGDARRVRPAARSLPRLANSAGESRVVAATAARRRSGLTERAQPGRRRGRRRSRRPRGRGAHGARRCLSSRRLH